MNNHSIPEYEPFLPPLNLFIETHWLPTGIFNIIDKVAC